MTGAPQPDHGLPWMGLATVRIRLREYLVTPSVTRYVVIDTTKI